MLKVGILKYDERVGATEFKAALLHMLCAQDGNFLPSGSASCEFACTNAPVSEDLAALSLCDKQVLELALAEASLRHCLLNGLGTQWCGRGVLEKD